MNSRAEAMVELRDFEPADGRRLMAWIDGPVELLTWAGSSFTWPLSEDQLAEYAAEVGRGERRSWMARDRSTGEVVGHASLRVDPAQLNSRLGRVLVAPDARGRGYAAAMLEKVLTVAFDDLGMERVELGVWAHNSSAVRLYERLGFVCHEVMPDVQQVAGQYRTANQMSLLKPAWNTRRAGVL